MAKEDSIVFDEDGEERDLEDVLADTDIASKDLNLFYACATDKGIKLLSDFGDDEKEVKALFTSLLKEANVDNVALKTVLKRLWKEANAGPKKPKKPEKPKTEVTTVELSDPKGTDIQGIEISLDNPEFSDGENVKLKIDTKLPDVGEFTGLDWAKLAKRARICHGLNLNKALEITNPESTTDAQSDLFTFNFYWPAASELKSDPVKVLNLGKTSSRSFYSANEQGEVENLIQSGGGSISGDYQGNGGSVSGDYSYYYRLATKNSKRKIFVTSHRCQYFVELDTTVLMRPSAHFEAAVDNALLQDGLDNQFVELQNVFADYGHVAPSKVTLGGLLKYQFSKVLTANVSDEAIEQVGRLAAEAHVKQGDVEVKAEGHGSHEDAKGNTFSAQSVSEQMSWTNIGGGPRTIENSSAWLESLSDPNLWRVVKRDGLRMVTEWLSPEKQEKVEKVLQHGRKILWDNRPEPTEVMFPPIMSTPSTKPKKKDEAPGLTPMTRVPFFIANGTNASSRCLNATNMGLTNLSTNSATQHHHPASSASRIINNTKRRSAYLWALIYTGITTGSHGQDGLPLFWITSYVSNEVDKNARNGGTIDPKCLALCAPEKSQKKLLIQTTRFDRVASKFENDGNNLPAMSDFDLGSYWTVVPEPPTSGRETPDVFNIVSQTGFTLTNLLLQFGTNAKTGGSMGMAMHKARSQRQSALGLGVHLIARPDLV